MEIAYSIEQKEAGKYAGAMGRDLNISLKNSVMVCDKLRGMMLPDAVKLLEATASLEKSVPFSRFNKGISHRKGQEKKVGKYPKKVANYILKILRNLQGNAEYKGLDSERLRIEHIQAQRGVSRRGIKPKGRWRVHRRQLVHVQAIAREV